jgi:hypothetical protein
MKEEREREMLIGCVNTLTLTLSISLSFARSLELAYRTASALWEKLQVAFTCLRGNFFNGDTEVERICKYEEFLVREKYLGCFLLFEHLCERVSSLSWVYCRASYLNIHAFAIGIFLLFSLFLIK